MLDLKRKPVDYELMEVGEELGPVEIDIDDHFVKAAAFVVDDYHPWYFTDDNPFERRVAPPAALLCDLLRLLYTRYDPSRDRGLHQKEEFRVHSPLYVGERVRLSGHFEDKFVKRQRGYVTTYAEARTIDDDRLIISHRAIESTEVTTVGRPDSSEPPVHEVRRISPGFAAGVTPLASFKGDFEPGLALQGPTKALHQDQISVYSGAHLFWESIHTSLRVAEEVGFDRPVAQGLMEASFLSEWAIALFGEKWFTSGAANLTFLKPVLAGERIELFGVVTDVGAGESGNRIEIETWFDNTRGEHVGVGWFSAES